MKNYLLYVSLNRASPAEIRSHPVRPRHSKPNENPNLHTNLRIAHSQNQILPFINASSITTSLLNPETSLNFTLFDLKPTSNAESIIMIARPNSNSPTSTSLLNHSKQFSAVQATQNTQCSHEPQVTEVKPRRRNTEGSWFCCDKFRYSKRNDADSASWKLGGGGGQCRREKIGDQKIRENRWENQGKCWSDFFFLSSSRRRAEGIERERDGESFHRLIQSHEEEWGEKDKIKIFKK